jgi:hypothetical protein
MAVIPSAVGSTARSHLAVFVFVVPDAAVAAQLVIRDLVLTVGFRRLGAMALVGGVVSRQAMAIRLLDLGLVREVQG